MKLVLKILLLFLTWFTNLSATAAYTKFALPSYEVSFSQTENVKEESAVKIGVVNFARNEITKNEPQTTYLQVGSFYKTLFSNNEKGNFSAPTFEKDLSKIQCSSFNFSKKEQLNLFENLAREDVCEVVQGVGKIGVNSWNEAVGAVNNLILPKSSQLKNLYPDAKFGYRGSLATGLTEVSQRLGTNTNATGKIKLFTERAPCSSCSNVIELFSKKHPKIEVEVIHNNGILLTDF